MLAHLLSVNSIYHECINSIVDNRNTHLDKEFMQVLMFQSHINSCLKLIVDMRYMKEYVLIGELANLGGRSTMQTFSDTKAPILEL